jgi:hypothetical protein
VDARRQRHRVPGRGQSRPDDVRGARRRPVSRQPGANFSRPEFSPDGHALYALESRDSTAKQIYFKIRLARLTGPRWESVSLPTAGWDRSVGAFTLSADSRDCIPRGRGPGVAQDLPSAGCGGNARAALHARVGSRGRALGRGRRHRRTPRVINRSRSDCSVRSRSQDVDESDGIQQGTPRRAPAAAARAFLVHGVQRQTHSLDRRAAASRASEPHTAVTS